MDCVQVKAIGDDEMKVYRVYVDSNGWKYNCVAGDIDCATLYGILAVEKFGGSDDWEMNISMVNVL